MTDSTSSSDEESRKRLLDAVDKEFISDGMFNGEHHRKEHTANELKDALPPSLRTVDSDNLDGNASGLNLTPEFQNYVGKQLAALLDKQLREVEPSGVKKRKRKKYKNRVKLLHSSGAYIELSTSTSTAAEASAAMNARRKAREAEKEEDSEEERARLKEAAVDCDWLISGEAIKGWAKSTKGELLAGEHAVTMKTDGGKKVKKKKKKKKGHQVEESMK